MLKFTKHLVEFDKLEIYPAFSKSLVIFNGVYVNL